MKHHYVPQFYQRGFIKDVNKVGRKEGLIWIYEKGRAPRKEPVANTGMEIDLYAFTDKDGTVDNKTVEDALGKIDNKGAAAIRKLDKGVAITDEERRDLCKFISAMYRRTPKFQQHQEGLAAELMPKFFEKHDEEWLRQEMHRQVKSPEQAELWFQHRKAEYEELREQYLRQPPDFLFSSNVLLDSVFERVLFDMDLALFKSTPDTDFVTCDDPALFSKGTGIGDRRSGVIMFPLSRELFLQAMWISEHKRAYVQLSDSAVRQLNRYVIKNANRQVYASYKSGPLSDCVDKWIGTA